jgi:hypothetical protein
MVASRDPELARALSAPLDMLRTEVEQSAPFLTDHPRLSATLAASALLGGAYYWRKYRRNRGLDRAEALVDQVGGRVGGRAGGWRVGGGSGRQAGRHVWAPPLRHM